MICPLEATSKAPQKAFATVVRGCFLVGSEPAHTCIAPQARPIASRYTASPPLIIALSLHLVAGSTPMTATVRVRQQPVCSPLPLAGDITHGILMVSKTRDLPKPSRRIAY